MNKRFDYIFDGVAIVFASIQPEVLFQYISLGLSILATLLSISFSIWQWWKKAKKDGKITSEEFKEGVEIIQNGTKELQHHLEDKNKGENK
ncbi:hypothetical protein IKD48_01120 [bacterium]|nr:hypothetical protein [bacterium]